jgi:hypothetical protein
MSCSARAALLVLVLRGLVLRAMVLAIGMGSSLTMTVITVNIS